MNRRAAINVWGLLTVLFAPILYGLSPMASTAQTSSTAPSPRYQAMWVDAFHDGLYSPEQIEEVVETARRHHFNTLFVQVLRSSDVLYRSSIFPRVRLLQGSDFDPLEHILKLAHDTSGGKARIDIHAWIIPYRATTTPEIPSGTLLDNHRDWQMLSYSNKRTFLGNRFVDPGVPGVQQYYVDIAREIARDYAVDGIHLDRIRYPAADAGYNKVALERFRILYGESGRPKPDNALWCDFRRRQVRDLVRRIYIEAKRINPDLVISAATIADGTVPSDFSKTKAYAAYYQNWPGWLREGWIDINCPMVYKREHVPDQKRDYRLWLDFARANRFGRHVIIGQAAYLNSLEATVLQFSLSHTKTGLQGTSLYSYANVSRDDSDSLKEVFSALAAQEFWAPVRPPRCDWMDHAEKGMLAGRIYFDGEAVDGGRVFIMGDGNEFSTYTDGTGFWAVARLQPGIYRVTVDGVPASKKSKTLRVKAGDIVYREDSY